jgi:hypothetical protein
MKTSILLLIAIAFFSQSCHTYAAIDLKDTPLFTDRNYKIKQTHQFEKVKLLSVNDSALIVLKHNIQKNILVSKIKEIKEENPSTLKTITFVASLDLPTIATIATVLRSDFVFDDFTIPKN